MNDKIKLIHNKPPLDVLPGGWEPDINFQLLGGSSPLRQDLFEETAFVVRDALTEGDCNSLLELMSYANRTAAVSAYGRLEDAGETLGSDRSTAWSEPLAAQLWRLLKGFLSIREMTDTSSTDWWQEGRRTRWVPYGLSPLLRFMNYGPGGQHFAHYDAGYFYQDKRFRTLMSYIVYLSTVEKGGATRFIKDGQEHLPVWQRKHDDWNRLADFGEVIAAVQPQKGSILLFDHRLCHDAEAHTEDCARIIIRGDVIFYAD